MILLVDGESDALERATSVLERAGHGVHAAPDCADAWQWLERRTPYLIVVDVREATTEGVVLIERLLGSQRLRPVPILVTADASAPDMVFASRSADYLARPYTDAQLLAACTRLVQTPATTNARAALSCPGGIACLDT